MGFPKKLVTWIMTLSEDNNIKSAIIFVGKDIPTETDVTLKQKICGVPLIERHLRLLMSLGITTIYFQADEEEKEYLSAIIHKNRRYRKLTVDVVSRLDDIHEKASIFMERHGLIDIRIMKKILQSEQRTVFVIDNGPVCFKAHKDDAPEATNFQKLAQYSRDNGHGIMLDDIDIYEANSRCSVPLMFNKITRIQDVPAIEDKIVAMAQKGTLDWPAEYIHPFFEDLAVRKIWNTNITPNEVTFIGAVLGGYLVYLFMTGHFLLALTGAIIVGILDGIDGKLARVKLMTSKIGEHEHTLDKILEYALYGAFGYGLSLQTQDDFPIMVAMVTIAVLFLDMLQGSWFFKKFGRQLDDIGAFERGFRIIGGRRNTHFWTLVPFGIFGFWELGNNDDCHICDADLFGERLAYFSV